MQPILYRDSARTAKITVAATLLLVWEVWNTVAENFRKHILGNEAMVLVDRFLIFPILWFEGQSRRVDSMEGCLRCFCMLFLFSVLDAVGRLRYSTKKHAGRLQMESAWWTILYYIYSVLANDPIDVVVASVDVDDVFGYATTHGNAAIDGASANVWRHDNIVEREQLRWDFWFKLIDIHGSTP